MLPIKERRPDRIEIADILKGLSVEDWEKWKGNRIVLRSVIKGRIP
jgi:hypothetical protein